MRSIFLRIFDRMRKPFWKEFWLYFIIMQLMIGFFIYGNWSGILFNRENRVFMFFVQNFVFWTYSIFFFYILLSSSKKVTPVYHRNTIIFLSIFYVLNFLLFANNIIKINVIIYIGKTIQELIFQNTLHIFTFL